MKRARAGAARLLRDSRGHTLTELMTVLAILGVVMGGLATMFQAGVRAELRADREYQAQQNARRALDTLRREIHCASAVASPSGVAVSTVTLTLPDICPVPDTTVTYATQSAGPNRWQLTRAGGSGTAEVIADYLTSSTPFTYYAPTVGTLGRLGVDLTVNRDPSDPATAWRLQDELVLRNTSRL